MAESGATQQLSVISGEWMDGDETMDALGIQKRTLQDWAHSGFLRFKQQTRKGKRPERVFLSADVQRLLRDGRPSVTRPVSAKIPREPRPPRSVRATPLELAIPNEGVTMLRELVERLAAPKVSPVSLTEKLWLSLDEAVQYSGLTRADLQETCQLAFKVQAECQAQRLPGALIVRKSGGWKILRKSLEAFEG
jgi:hypothetical protein